MVAGNFYLTILLIYFVNLIRYLILLHIDLILLYVDLYNQTRDGAFRQREIHTCSKCQGKRMNNRKILLSFCLFYKTYYPINIY